MKNKAIQYSIKISILAGLFFGLCMAFFILPMAYLVGKLEGGLWLSTVMAAGFAVLTGIHLLSSGARLASSITLEDGERLLYEGKANRWANHSSFGGFLYLTNQRLVFFAYRSPSCNLVDEYSLQDLDAVVSGLAWRMQGFGLLVMTVFDDQGVRYTVKNRRLWKKKIDAAVAARPKPKTWAELHTPHSPRSMMSADEFILQHGAFPQPDRSHIPRNTALSTGQLDLGWNRGEVYDGNYQRPFFAETWADQGHVTNQTIFFSRIGLEDITAEQVLGNFRANGLIDWVIDPPCEILRIEDRNGHPLWSVNVCLGAGDTIYVSKSLVYQPY